VETGDSQTHLDPEVLGNGVTGLCESQSNPGRTIEGSGSGFRVNSSSRPRNCGS